MYAFNHPLSRIARQKVVNVISAPSWPRFQRPLDPSIGDEAARVVRDALLAVRRVKGEPLSAEEHGRPMSHGRRTAASGGFRTFDAPVRIV